MRLEWSEQLCLERVRKARWPDGIRCPRCSDSDWRLHARGGGRPKYRCLRCGRTFNDLTGTVFAHSHLDLSKWFECARALHQGPKTCVQLSRLLGVKVATAWRLRKALRRAFCDPALVRLFEEVGSFVA